MRSVGGSCLSTHVESGYSPSPALLQANRRLYELRKQTQAARPFTESPPEEAPVYERGATAVPAPPIAETIETLPEHLGWGSEAVTAVVRTGYQRQRERAARAAAQSLSWLPALPCEKSPPSAAGKESTGFSAPHVTPDATVKLYPSIALGILRHKQAAAGRLWLLLRFIDQDGRGWISVEQARTLLTDKTSALRICGRRQLRNLLRRGQDIFWRRDKERIWLRSVTRVAAALAVERLTGQPVALPVALLLGGIGDVRAHFYASFHSGRTRETAHGAQAMPIARQTLARISGVGQRSQRAYEKRAGVDVQHNFAVGETAAAKSEQARAWQQGNALFRLRDHRGYQGPQGKTYLAWQLPNTYYGCHAQRPKGRQKRINRELADLFLKGMAGNGEEHVEKRFYANGKLAAQGFNRQPDRDVYWQRRQLGNGRNRVWQVISAAR